MDDRKIIYINLAEITLKTNFVNDRKISVLLFCVFPSEMLVLAVALDLTNKGLSRSEQRWQELSICIRRFLDSETGCASLN